MGERAVARIFLEDETFKTFLITPTTTAAVLEQQVSEKLRTEQTYFLYYRLPDKTDHYLKSTDLPWKVLREHGESATFIFKTSPPMNALAASSASMSLGSSASLGGVGQSVRDLKASASTAAFAASDSDFDSLLDQLNVDLENTAVSAAEVANLPLCSACGQPIKSNLLKAFGMNWHKEHLACAICHQNFQENDVDVVEGNDGNAYCKTDFLERYAPKCARCEKPISGLCTNAIGKTWHVECFNCMTCAQPFPNSFFEHEGQPYCEKHYFDVLGLLCPTCERPIIGKCLNAHNKRYHTEHFVCYHCKKRLKQNTYYWHERTDKPYCKECNISLFG